MTQSPNTWGRQWGSQFWLRNAAHSSINCASTTSTLRVAQAGVGLCASLQWAFEKRPLFRGPFTVRRISLRFLSCRTAHATACAAGYLTHPPHGFTNHPPSAPITAGQSSALTRQLLTLSHDRAGTHSIISNRSDPRLEMPESYTKQRTEPLSNRHKFTQCFVARSPKGVPACGVEGGGAAESLEDGDGALARDLADGMKVARAGSATQFSGEAARDGKKELVVVAAVERGLKWIEAFAAQAALAHASSLANAACAADASEICGKSVGEIDHRGGDFALSEPRAELNASARVKMLRDRLTHAPIPHMSGERERESELRAPKRTAHIYKVTGPGTGSRDGASGTTFADHSEAQKSFRVARR